MRIFCFCFVYRPGGGIILSDHLPRVVLALLLFVALLLHVLGTEASCRRALVRVSLEGTTVLVIVVVSAVLCLSFRWFRLQFVSGQIGFLVL